MTLEELRRQLDQVEAQAGTDKVRVEVLTEAGTWLPVEAVVHAQFVDMDFTSHVAAIKIP